jgi:hypothetical protein
MHFIAAFMLCATCAAQSITVVNPTGYAWRGWLRVPHATPWPATFNDSTATWSVAASEDEASDVFCAVAPGSSATFDFGMAAAWVRPLPQFYDVSGVHGGLPTVNGQAMDLRACVVDGAGFRLKWSHALDADWIVGLNVLVYPSERCFAVAEASLLRWSGARPSPVVATLTTHVSLAWGTAQALPPIWSAGHAQADGEVSRARAVFVWPALCGSSSLDAAACARAGGPTVN